jgi:hypothetical protein
VSDDNKLVCPHCSDPDCYNAVLHWIERGMTRATIERANYATDSVALLCSTAGSSETHTLAIVTALLVTRISDRLGVPVTTFLGGLAAHISQHSRTRTAEPDPTVN